MDLISHGLTGRLLSVNPKNSKRDVFLVILFSLLPDIFFSAFYFFLGYENQRFLSIPRNSDWANASILHPVLNSITGQIPHSLIFALLVILPIVLLFKLPRLAFFAYLTHILLDIPSHSGEWNVALFYPLSDFSINGLANFWQWPIKYMAVIWLALIVLIIFFKRKNAHSSNSDRTNP